MSDISYVVYSTSNSPYQDWQGELLDYTFHKVRQPGRLIRLCSVDDAHPQKPFAESRYAEVFKMRSWMKNEKTGDYWGIANKFNAIKLWLETYSYLKDDEVVLFLDPDMVFIKPVHYSLEAGEVVGQRWLDPDIEKSPRFAYAGENRELITEEYVVMFPFCITVGDMRRIIDRSISLAYEIREKEDCWEADMYAMIIAMAECNLQVRTEMIGIFTTWEKYRDQLYSIIHYPHPIYSDHEKKNKIWFKQEYTKETETKPWTLPPDPGCATNITEKMLLAVIRNYINSDQHGDTRKPEKKKYKLYTHKFWRQYSWESMNDSLYMEWDIYRCDHGNPYPPPGKNDTVFYTDTELGHAVKHDCKRKIAFMLEAKEVTPGSYSYLERVIDTFDMVLTHNDCLVEKYPDKCLFYPHGNCVIKREDFTIYEKTKLVSFISSRKDMNVSGHRMRHEFYRQYLKRQQESVKTGGNLVEVDLYGALAGKYIEYKLDSLREYRFQVVIENSVFDTYFTEKIIDCFVTGTIPIYRGTRKIGKFFDPEGIIRFSTLDDLFAVLSGLSADCYESRRAAMERNFALARQYIVPEDWIYENTDVFG